MDNSLQEIMYLDQTLKVFRIAAKGRDPLTVGESSHLSWLHQDNSPMHAQRPIFEVRIDFGQVDN